MWPHTLLAQSVTGTRMLTLAALLVCLASFSAAQNKCECIAAYYCTNPSNDIVNWKGKPGGGGGYTTGSCKCECESLYEKCCEWSSSGSGNTGTPDTPDTSVPPPPPPPDTEAPPTSQSYECGVRGSEPDDLGSQDIWKVISFNGDVDTFEGEWPWMVAITNIGPSGKPQFLCGGSLIGYNLILTAAHTLRNISANELRVNAGVWSSNDTEEGQVRFVSQVIPHPNFSKRKVRDDFALLVLSEPVTITKTVVPVCLPTLDRPYNSSNCVATGWGSDNYGNNKIESYLKKVKLPLVDFDTCQDQLRKVVQQGAKFNLSRSFICAGGENADTCKGDGGGPLMCASMLDPNRYVQVGITAWGVGCNKGPPGVYSAVETIIDWITDTSNAYPPTSRRFRP